MCYCQSMSSRDTSAAAAAVHEDLYRQAGPLRKLTIALELSDLTHELAVAGVRLRYPDYDIAGARRALAEQLYGGDRTNPNKSSHVGNIYVHLLPLVLRRHFFR